MKIKGLVAGLGIAGKVALGASLAAAATTGAGAAGILPGPVQHVVASTVDAVTPFHLDDGQGQSGSNEGAGATEPSSTTQPATTTTEQQEPSTTIATTTSLPGGGHGGDSGSGSGDTTPATNPGDGGNGGVVTPTTEHHAEPTEPVTTTTEHHDGDSNNPESLSIGCERATNPNRIVCHWTASSSPDHDKYVLLRITSLNDPGRVLLQSPDALSFTDTMVTSGVGYGYRVISLRGDGTVESHSNIATIMCCGDAGSGGGGGGDSTTTTTQPHESTTTTEHHDGSTTTTTHI